MNRVEQKFGVYDPVKKVFYSVPAKSQEDFKMLMLAFGFLDNKK